MFLSDSTGGPLKGPACPLKALAGPVLGITQNTLRTSQISRWQGQYSCDKAVTRFHTQLRLASEGNLLDSNSSASAADAASLAMEPRASLRDLYKFAVPCKAKASLRAMPKTLWLHACHQRIVLRLQSAYAARLCGIEGFLPALVPYFFQY